MDLWPAMNELKPCTCSLTGPAPISSVSGLGERGCRSADAVDQRPELPSFSARQPEAHAVALAATHARG